MCVGGILLIPLGYTENLVGKASRWLSDSLWAGLPDRTRRVLLENPLEPVVVVVGTPLPLFCLRLLFPVITDNTIFKVLKIRGIFLEYWINSLGGVCVCVNVCVCVCV